MEWGKVDAFLMFLLVAAACSFYSESNRIKDTEPLRQFWSFMMMEIV